MNGTSRDKFSTELNSATRDLGLGVGVGVEIDVVAEIDTSKSGGTINNFDSPHGNTFERDCFVEDEWMRQLQGDDQQQYDLIGQGSGDGLTSLEQPQFRFLYEQNTSLATQSSENNDNDVGGPLHGMEQAQPLEGRKRLEYEWLQRLPSLQRINGLPQQDNMAARNNLFQQQQQQQQQQHPLYSNYGNQTINNTLRKTQALDNQMESLKQQQQEQNQRLHQQHHQQREQLAASKLQQSLVQLQRLQEQQQQILKSISHTGLIQPNGFLDPLSTLLMNTLTSQTNNGNNGNGGNNNSIDTTNTTAICAEKSAEMQELQVDVNSLPNEVPNITNFDPQIQPLQMDYFENKDISHDSQQQHQQQVMLMACQQPLNGNNGCVENNFPLHGKGSSSSNNNNVDEALAIEPSPLIRKTDKKREPRPFPKQLWEAMMDEGASNDKAFEWLPDGKSFVVVDPDLFCNRILDRKFKQSKYGSFVRKLHRWGFIRLTSGTGTDCFHHPMFQRTRPDLVLQIKCYNRNGKACKDKGQNPYARGDIVQGAQPSLMGVEKFIRAKVVSPESTDDVFDERNPLA